MQIFDAIVDAERKVLYEMGEDLNSLVKVASYEKLDLKLSIKKEIGLTIVATIDLSLKGETVECRVSRVNNYYLIRSSLHLIFSLFTYE